MPITARGLAVASVAGLLASAAPAQEADHRAMAEAVHQSFEAGTAERDLEALTALFAPEAIYLSADGETLQGRAAIRGYFERRPFTVTDIESALVEPLGASLLLDIGTYAVAFPAETGLPDQDGEYVVVVDTAGDRPTIRSLVAFPPRALEGE